MSTTFSQMIDSAIQELRRPDLLTDATSYLNQTLREVHFEPSKGNTALYRDNRQETQVTATSDTGFSWGVPNPPVFQGLAAVRYDSCVDIDGKPKWAIEMNPGRGMNSRLEYWYRNGPIVFFAGYGGVNATISLAWYEYVKSLKYYPVASRPASYDEDTGWTYAPGIISPDDQLAAQAKVTNWLLMRWDQVIWEGLRAKIFKRVSDDIRSRTTYSLYSTLRQGLFSSEAMDISGSW